LFTDQQRPQQPQYLHSAGNVPWFTGLSFFEDTSLCEALQRLSEPVDSDIDETAKKKDFLRSAVATITNKHDVLSTDLTQAYQDPQKAVLPSSVSIETYWSKRYGQQAKNFHHRRTEASQNNQV
jgi:hypothetical protein